MVRHAVGLVPNAKLEHSIREIWRELRSAGIASNLLDDRGRPHLSLAVCGGLPQDFEREFELFARGVRRMKLSLQAAGTFGVASGVVFLAPAITVELRGVHKSFHQSFGGRMDDCSGLYAPGNWVPHCTVAMGLEKGEICRAIGICAGERLPLEGMMTEAALMRFQSNSVISCTSFPLAE